MNRPPDWRRKQADERLARERNRHQLNCATLFSRPCGCAGVATVEEVIARMLEARAEER